MRERIISARNSILERPELRYSLAVVVVAVALALRLTFSRVFGSGLTYITFSPAVMLAAVLGGFGPGLFATVLSALAADYFIIPPVRGFAIADAGDAVGLALFVAMGVFMSGVAGLYHRSRRRAEEYERELLVRKSDERFRNLAEAMPDFGLVRRRRWQNHLYEPRVHRVYGPRCAHIRGADADSPPGRPAHGYGTMA